MEQSQDRVQDRVIRDVQAAELLLRHPRIIEWVGVPQCGITPKQLDAAVKIAESSGKIAALVCEDCEPYQKYLVIRVIDLPLLVARVYEVLTKL